MKKLLIITCLLFSALTLRAEDYFDLQHFTVIPDTITISNDYYYRGTFRITSDTFTVRLDSAPDYTVIFTTLAATINLPTTINSTLDVTGTLDVDGTLTGHGEIAVFDNLHLLDNIELRAGNGDDFSLGFDSGENDFRIVIGGNVTTDANVAFVVNASKGVEIPNMKTGVDQAGAGAIAGELWAESDDGFAVRLGQ